MVRSTQAAGSDFQPSHGFQILLALFDPALIARLVLGADKGVGAARAVGGDIQIAARLTNHRLNVSAPRLSRFQGPCFLCGIVEELGKVAAVGARTGKLAVPPPVPRGFERFGDTGAQVGQRGGAIANRREGDRSCISS